LWAFTAINKEPESSLFWITSGIPPCDLSLKIERAGALPGKARFLIAAKTYDLSQGGEWEGKTLVEWPWRLIPLSLLSEWLMAREGFSIRYDDFFEWC